MSRRPGRGRNLGFSLIELLIVVAIIAALVGVAVPFFQDNLAEAQRTKAREDLAILQKAIYTYEARENRLLAGTSLGPLLGRYLQELPKDPWGNEYLWDGTAGFLGSYGADALPLGAGGDEDVMASQGLTDGPDRFPVLPVILRRVQYQGSWGPPRPPIPPDFKKFQEGNKFVLGFSRAVAELDPAAFVARLSYRPPEGSSAPSGWLTSPENFLPGTWRTGGDGFFVPVGRDPLHEPAAGSIVVRACVDNVGAPLAIPVPIRPAGKLNLEGVPDPFSAAAGLTPTYAVGANPASALEVAIYGAAARTYMPPAIVEITDGVLVEKY